MQHLELPGRREGQGWSGNAIVGNEILDSERYGIDLADAAAGIRIESNTIRDSGDEGIHVGTGASDNLILGNQFVKSKAENVYLLAASGTRVIGNVMVDSIGRRGDLHQAQHELLRRRQHRV